MIYTINEPTPDALTAGATYREDIQHIILFYYRFDRGRPDFRDICRHHAAAARWQCPPPDIGHPLHELCRTWLEREPQEFEQLNSKEREKVADAIKIGDYVAADIVVREHIFPIVFAQLTGTAPPASQGRPHIVKRFLSKLFNI